MVKVSCCKPKNKSMLLTSDENTGSNQNGICLLHWPLKKTLISFFVEATVSEQVPVVMDWVWLPI